MKGKYKITIETPKEVIEIELKRKYTILKGFTGTGKSYLPVLIDRWYSEDLNVPVKIKTELPITVVTSMRSLKGEVDKKEEGIIFLDESRRFMYSEDFATITSNAVQYFLLCSRDDLPNLTYSIDEVYALSSDLPKNKKQKVKTVFTPYFKRFRERIFKPNYIIVEDTKSGYELYKEVFKDVEVIGAGGNSNTYRCAEEILENGGYNIIVIIDGAGGGSCTDELMRLLDLYSNRNVLVLCPESFEYLILRSELCTNFRISDELDCTYDYCESSIYSSWEDYYEKRLKELTFGTLMQYKKSKLPKYYKGKNAVKVIKVLEKEG